MEAWHCVFYIKIYDNSWFIYFNKNYPQDFPVWFASGWWEVFSLEADIIFNRILKRQKVFYEFKQTKSILPSLHFMATFGIPWIVCWDYKIRKDDGIGLSQ